jgi:2'-5' RNA ligase
MTIVFGASTSWAASCSKKELSKFNPAKSSNLEARDFYACFHDKELYSISLPGLIELVSKSNNPSFQDENLKKALENVPRKYEYFVFKKLYNKKLLVSPKVTSDLRYFFALQRFDQGRIKSALWNLSKQTGVDFNRYGQSQFLEAVIMTKLGKKDEAEAIFSELSKGKFKAPTKEIKDRIKSMSKLNLARIKIEQENYKSAIENYRNVSFRENEWFDGLVEMSWAMTSRGDYEGAIGNAGFVEKSTSDYIYKPWISVIESIGLLKICQYPNAKKSVEHFRTDYDKSGRKTLAYIKKNEDKSWYTFATEVLATPVTKSTAKKTPPLLFYAAKSNLVVGNQIIINDLIDEEVRLEKMKRRLRRYKSSFAYKLIVSRLSTINKGINKSQVLMGQAFKTKVVSLLKELRELEKIIDILDFEIFARSSNNITMRVAGEKFIDKMKKAGNKESSWNYNGEFWTDEAGRFRSLLKNKCVKD